MSKDAVEAEPMHPEGPLGPSAADGESPLSSQCPSPVSSEGPCVAELAPALDSASALLARSDNQMQPDLIAETRRKSFQKHKNVVSPTQAGDSLRRYGDEVPTSSRWTHHKKHFFILSSAGKPIYSRYGDEAKLSSFMGLIQAILSFFASDDDSIRCLNAGSHKFVFSMKGPLYLVAVSSTGESELQLRQQLECLYAQILFVLTGAALTRIFETRGNYDLRNLLSGTEMFLDHLSGAFQSGSGYFLGAIPCLRMSSRLRQKIGNVLAIGTPKSLVFGILIARDKLVTLVRPKRYSLHPTDLHLVMNMISSSSGFRSVETWTPVCFPQFNNRAFLHTYVCFLGTDLCLVLASTDKDAFFEMSEYKQQISQGLETTGCVEAIDDAIRADPYSIVEVEVPSLRHFIYKSTTLVQYTEPSLSAPYTRKEDRRRLLRAYQYALERMHARENPARVIFHATPTEAVMSYSTPTHEIYASFSPLVSKAAAMEGIAGLQKWIKREESSIFVPSAPVF
ncbi:uncharacterized protein SPPG_07355 [Spizellomyces punctatus DAOM BR117]|uniref:Vacuolar fusion protein MON1 n=1 Tax=Spizellomyces punctatus (strain DAOM BR117) TaxID=645134 RepID=A0A0L0H883_SPIPD|nr:uncharacterized protein SPPG_07355 [Spizellomyces punctatus DAOM BR117]KNC97432.1 hypothetical protein SPPG_07355 [Spizellomyces punctatus DAOM BR117]|eukprot:XP_016605472.1 hypothetical protein SPPG_07355 [Spizellomyces punctatus DAOM BR117]